MLKETIIISNSNQVETYITIICNINMLKKKRIQNVTVNKT